MLRKANIDDFVFPELHAELQPFLDGDLLNHPLLHLDPAIPAFYPRINKLYIYLKDIAASPELEISNQWTQYESHLSSMDKQIHFMKNELGRTDPEYFCILGHMWTDIEILSSTSSLLELLLGFNPHTPELDVHLNSHYMMTHREQDLWDKLPNNLTVYRGHHHRTFHGISWTLDRNVALQYALGTSLNYLISKGNVEKSDAIAFIDRWDESEILVLSDWVKDIETLAVKEEPSW